MTSLIPTVDPDGLLEYSVVYTDRALNHMSQAFQGVMRDISRVLKTVYHAQAAIIVPGSGTFGMEAVARQFATNKRCLVIRNGWFSYRWSQIFDMGGIPASTEVLKARPVTEGRQAAYAPPPIEEVVAAIREHKPEMVFAPHVETASGILLPDGYLRAVADATHAVGGLFVLDCIASGTIWVDMEASGVDILISERIAVLCTGDAQRSGAGETRNHHQHQLLVRPAQVVANHAGVRERRFLVSRDDADRCVEGIARRHARNRSLRFRKGSR
jgi:aspartate aminotransferase-like enzyme